MSRHLLLPFFAIPLLVGCTDPYEPAPPKPLTFAGAALGDEMPGQKDVLHPIAVGGEQDIAIFDQDNDAPLVGQYNATSDAAGVRVASSDRNIVTLAADAAGEGRLRIASTDGSEMDGIDIAAAPVARAAVSWPYMSDLVIPRGRVKLFTGTHQALVVALFDADGRRVIDDSATIRLNGPGAGLEQTAWDTFSLARVPVGTTSTSFTVVVGADTFTANVDAVDAVDAVELVAPIAETATLGIALNVCFVARSGDAHVLGAPWQFTVSGAGELVPWEIEGTMPNCALVRTNAVGTTTVTAAIGATTASATFEILAP